MKVVRVEFTMNVVSDKRSSSGSAWFVSHEAALENLASWNRSGVYEYVVLGVESVDLRRPFNVSDRGQIIFQ